MADLVPDHVHVIGEFVQVAIDGEGDFRWELVGRFDKYMGPFLRGDAAYVNDVQAARLVG